MKGTTVENFIDTLYNCPDLEFSFRGKKYMLEMWRNDNGAYSITINSIESKPQCIFKRNNLSISQCVSAFEEATIFNGLTIYQAENEIEVLYG